MIHNYTLSVTWEVGRHGSMIFFHTLQIWFSSGIGLRWTAMSIIILNWHTNTFHSIVVRVRKAKRINTVVTTVKYARLIAITWNRVQNHQSSSSTQVRISSWNSSKCVESQLSAHNICISAIPSIVTDCSPVSINTHFNSSSPSCPTRAKTNTAVCTVIWT